MSATIPSPGLQFMLTAFNAMPRSLGDRVRIAALGEALSLAIKCRMRFAKTDIEELHSLRQHTCVGVFRPFDERFYKEACVAGGTFPAVWEKASNTAPWIAPEVLERSAAETMADNRVAPGLAVLISNTDDAADKEGDDLATVGQKQLWWCTSISNEQLVLCRYRKNPKPYSRDPHGQPAKIWKFTRDQWRDQFGAVPHSSEAA
jgi:hypothetical protein